MTEEGVLVPRTVYDKLLRMSRDYDEGKLTQSQIKDNVRPPRRVTISAEIPAGAAGDAIRVDNGATIRIYNPGPGTAIGDTAVFWSAGQEVSGAKGQWEIVGGASLNEGDVYSVIKSIDCGCGRWVNGSAAHDCELCGCFNPHRRTSIPPLSVRVGATSISWTAGGGLVDLYYDSGCLYKGPDIDGVEEGTVLGWECDYAAGTLKLVCREGTSALVLEYCLSGSQCATVCIGSWMFKLSKVDGFDTTVFQDLGQSKGNCTACVDPVDPNEDEGEKQCYRCPAYETVKVSFADGSRLRDLYNVDDPGGGCGFFPCPTISEANPLAGQEVTLDFMCYGPRAAWVETDMCFFNTTDLRLPSSYSGPEWTKQKAIQVLQGMGTLPGCAIWYKYQSECHVFVGMGSGYLGNPFGPRLTYGVWIARNGYEGPGPSLQPTGVILRGEWQRNRIWDTEGEMLTACNERVIEISSEREHVEEDGTSGPTLTPSDDMEDLGGYGGVTLTFGGARAVLNNGYEGATECAGSIIDPSTCSVPCTVKCVAFDGAKFWQYQPNPGCGDGCRCDGPCGSLFTYHESVGNAADATEGEEKEIPCVEGEPTLFVTLTLSAPDGFTCACATVVQMCLDTGSGHYTAAVPMCGFAAVFEYWTEGGTYKMSYNGGTVGSGSPAGPFGPWSAGGTCSVFMGTISTP